VVSSLVGVDGSWAVPVVVGLVGAASAGASPVVILPPVPLSPTGRLDAGATILPRASLGLGDATSVVASTAHSPPALQLVLGVPRRVLW